MKSSRIIGNALKIIGVVTSLIIAIFSFTQLIEFYEKRSTKLESFYFEQDHITPASVFDRLNYENRSLLSEKISSEIFERDSCVKRYTIERIVNQNFDSLFRLDYFSYREMFKQVRVVVKNNHRKSIKNVVLETSSSGYYAASRQDGDISSGEYKHLIDLGDIFPKNDIIVDFWTMNYDNNSLKINYDEGYLYPKKLSVLTGKYVWLANNEKFIFGIICIVAIGVGLYFFLLKKLKEEEIDDKSETE